jgi:hypothetical protein
MKTYIYLWQYLAHFFLEWEMFQTKLVEEITTCKLCSITFSHKSCRLPDNVEKYSRARQATNNNILRRVRSPCWVTKVIDAHSDYVILLFDGNNGYANAPQCCSVCLLKRNRVQCYRLWTRKLTQVSQLVKKFPAFDGTRRFVTAFTRARHLPLSCAILIRFTPPHPFLSDPH